MSNKKLLAIVIIFAVLSVMVAGFIFSNSLQNSDESNARSGKLAKLLRPLIDPMHRMDDESFHILVRKLAHFLEYGLLGVCLGGTFVTFGYIKKRRYVSLPLLIAMTTAVVDEYLQSFVGRSSCVKDVLIDSAGAVCGILGMTILAILIQKILQGRNKYESETGLQ